MPASAAATRKMVTTVAITTPRTPSTSQPMSDATISSNDRTATDRRSMRCCT